MLKYYRYVWQYRMKVWPWQLRRRSVAEGFINGRRLWQIVGVVLYFRELMRKVLRPEPELVATASLRPGAAVIIETIDPRYRAGRLTRRSRAELGARERARAAALRRTGAPPGRQTPALPRDARRGRGVPQPRRLRRPRRPGRDHRGDGRALDPGRRVHGAAPDARGLRHRDAARRPGDLPQGPRPDVHAGRHRPGRAGLRVRRRFGRAVDDDAALRRRRRRLRAPRGLRQPGPGQRGQLPR